MLLLAARCGERCHSAVLSLDTFSLDHSYANRHAIVKRNTALGGACTGSLGVVLVGLIAGTLLQFLTDNTLVTTRFDPAGGSIGDDGVTGTWALDVGVVVDGVTSLEGCPPAASALRFSGGGTGVQNMPWGSTTGLNPSPQDDSSLTVCRYRAQCSQCALQSTLRARMGLPAGAQAVAWALTVNRAVTPDTPGQRVRSVISANQGATDSQRLRSGTWTLTATRETLRDVRDGQTASGYLLAFVDQDTTFLDSSAPVSGFVPQLNPVSLEVAVTLSPSASTVTVSDLQSVLGLLGSLGGLLGAVIGLWRLVYSTCEDRLVGCLVPLGLVHAADHHGHGKTAPLSPAPGAGVAAAPVKGVDMDDSVPAPHVAEDGQEPNALATVDSTGEESELEEAIEVLPGYAADGLK